MTRLPDRRDEAREKHLVTGQWLDFEMFLESDANKT
jgi:hypothetical protein